MKNYEAVSVSEVAPSNGMSQMRQLGVDVALLQNYGGEWKERNGQEIVSGDLVMDILGNYYQINGEESGGDWPVIDYETRKPLHMEDSAIYMVLER